MGKKSAPAPPDPVAVSQAQAQANKEAVYASAETNAVNRYGPGYTVEYETASKNGYNVPVAQHITLDPASQEAFDRQQQITLDLTGRAQTALANAPQTAFTLDNAPYDPRNYDTSLMPQYNATSVSRHASLGPQGRPGGQGPGGRPGPGQGGPGGGPGPGGRGPRGPGGQGNEVGSDNGIWSLPGTQNQGGDVLPYDPRSYGNVGAINRQAADSVFNEAQRNLQPQFDRQNERVAQDLHNRGIPIGSEAHRKAMEDVQRNQNNALIGASNQAYMAGHQVAGDLIGREQNLRGVAFSEGMQSHQQATSDFMNRLQTEQNLRGSVISEDERVRNSAVNDASLYLTGAPAINMPQAPQIPKYNVNAPDVEGNHWRAYEAQRANAQQSSQSIWGGIGQMAGLAGSIFSHSDLKEELGPADSFLPRARKIKLQPWRYTPEAARFLNLDTDKHFGPYAQEWAALFGGDGVRININDAVFVLWRAFQQLCEEVDAIKVERANVQ
jgi:hypothetical protein